MSVSKRKRLLQKIVEIGLASAEEKPRYTIAREELGFSSDELRWLKKKFGDVQPSYAGVVFESCVFGWNSFEVLNPERAIFQRCNFSYVSFHQKSLCGAQFSDCVFERTQLTGCTYDDHTMWGSETQLLRARWRACSDELTKELMRYDAANHPVPEAFNHWAKGGDCPYSDRYRAGRRAVNFLEDAMLWDPECLNRPAKSAYELLQMLLKEKLKRKPLSRSARSSLTRGRSFRGCECSDCKK